MFLLLALCERVNVLAIKLDALGILPLLLPKRHQDDGVGGPDPGPERGGPLSLFPVFVFVSGE